MAKYFLGTCKNCLWYGECDSKSRCSDFTPITDDVEDDELKESEERHDFIEWFKEYVEETQDAEDDFLYF